MLPSLYALLTITVTTASGKPNIGDEDFQVNWPEKYSVEANRVSLTSGIVEDYIMWRTNSSSRIDYNHGAVQSIMEQSKLNFPEGVHYEIHPEANKDGSSQIKCNVMNGSWTTIELETILPDAYDFIFTDYDAVNDMDTIKFEYKKVEEGSDTRQSLWAVFDNETETWTPVKLEIQKYNQWLGFLNKHEIWTFYNFYTDFDDAEVFDTDDFGCEEEEYTEHRMNSEAVTKHLLFIDTEKEQHVDHVFNVFKSKYNRNYKGKKEDLTRRNIFQNKMRLIKSTNRKNLGYKLAVNQFADRTPEEMKKHQGLLRRPEGKSGNIPFPYTNTHIKDIETGLPYEYDLRLLGYVTAVKNQEACGSCWTFGTTVAMEGALARQNGGKLISLANQALVDCAWPYGAAGCNGGSDNAAYEWMMDFGLPTVAEYGPYMNRDGYCNINNMTTIYPIKGFTDVTPFSVGALKVALVNHGPLSVSVHVTDAFALYSGGIFYDTECNPLSLNHEVGLVGYGTRDGETFWIIKNSWGPTWGVDGYMLISARDNNCGITTEPTYINL